MTDLIFLFVLVAFVAMRLYSVLGKENDDKSVHVVLKPVNKNDEAVVDNVVQIVKAKEAVDNATGKAESSEEFNKEMFLQGARRVFELVLNAFSRGDLLPVKDLVSKKVFEAINGVITERKENNITSEVDFICFDKSEVKDVKMLKNSIKVVVEFVSEQVNLLRNAKGEVVEGDENFVQKITDVWTFERMLNAKNNNWVLVSTKKTA